MFHDCAVPRPLQFVRASVGRRGRFLGVSISGYVCLCVFHCHCVLIGHNLGQINLHFQGRKKGITSHDDRLLLSRRFLVFGCLWVSPLLAAWIHLRTRADAFSDSMGGFLLLSVSPGEAKGGQFREMFLGLSLPPLFHLLAWFCSKSWLNFIFPAICHCHWIWSNGCVSGPGEVAADSQSTERFPCGVWGEGGI